MRKKSKGPERSPGPKKRPQSGCKSCQSQSQGDLVDNISVSTKVHYHEQGFCIYHYYHSYLPRLWRLSLLYMIIITSRVALTGVFPRVWSTQHPACDLSSLATHYDNFGHQALFINFYLHRRFRKQCSLYTDKKKQLLRTSRWRWKLSLIETDLWVGHGLHCDLSQNTENEKDLSSSKIRRMGLLLKL